MTRSADASGWVGVRSASAAATTAASVRPRSAAMRVSADQNSGSSATDVRCPANEKLRLTRRLSFHLPAA